MDGRTLRHIEFDTVADLYDTYVRTDFDIPFWIEESTATNGRVLELACGTGRVSIPLLNAGVDLSCVDIAPKMLARLHQKLTKNGRTCPVYCQDIAELNLPDRFDLLFIAFHSFSEIIDRQRQRLALRRIRLHLTPQGIFICTLQNPVVRTSTMDGTMRLIGEFPFPGGGTLAVKSRLVFDRSTNIASGEQVYDHLSAGRALVNQRKLDVSFYLFDKTEFAAMLDECGFSVEAVYGDYERHPFNDAESPFMIWKLRRNATNYF